MSAANVGDPLLNLWQHNKWIVTSVKARSVDKELSKTWKMSNRVQVHILIIERSLYPYNSAKAIEVIVKNKLSSSSEWGKNAEDLSRTLALY